MVVVGPGPHYTSESDGFYHFNRAMYRSVISPSDSGREVKPKTAISEAAVNKRVLISPANDFVFTFPALSHPG
jgi:hypothetical protein